MKRLKTRIWLEESEEENPFSARQSWLHGQDFFGRLSISMTYGEMVYFHFLGRKPTPHRRKWFEALLCLMSNPGIRDESTQVAINVAIGQGPVGHPLLAGLLARSGEARGAAWLESAMTTLQAPAGKQPGVLPGLGLHFGSRDHRVEAVLPWFKSHRWWGRYGKTLEKASAPEVPLLLEGLIAAGLLDLGFSPAQGALIFLGAGFPGLAAFALEQRDLGLGEYPNLFEGDRLVYQAPASRKRG